MFYFHDFLTLLKEIGISDKKKVCVRPYETRSIALARPCLGNCSFAEKEYTEHTHTLLFIFGLFGVYRAELLEPNFTGGNRGMAPATFWT